MADATKKRIHVYGPKGSGTVPEYQLATAMRNGYFPADEGGNVEPGLIERTWNKFNTGLVSPETVLKGVGAPPMAALEHERDRPPTASEVPPIKPDELKGPKNAAREEEARTKAFSRVFNTGMMADLARTMSGMTSPASLGTAALSQTARIPGAIGKIARALLTAQGVAYGAHGVKEGAEGIQEGVMTPGGAEKTLSGAAQVVGAAPSAAEIKRVGEGAISKIMPGVFAREERAFLGALRPTIKDAPALRASYNDLRDELRRSGVKDFPELRDFAEQGRKGAASELAGRIFRRSPTAGNINATQVGDLVRKRVTPWMKLRTSTGGALPPEAQNILDEATNIEQNLIKHPMNLSQAEQVVQDINAELNKFRKLPPDAQYQAIRSGDPVAVMTAVKEGLQDQIESRLVGYTDLKRRYGSYKELQQQTERRMDQLDRESGQMDWASRRASENLGSMFGAIFSGQFLHGLADIFAGRAGGDVMIEGLHRPERMLRRGMMSPPPPLPFAGQVAQTTAAGKDQQ